MKQLKKLFITLIVMPLTLCANLAEVIKGKPNMNNDNKKQEKILSTDIEEIVPLAGDVIPNKEHHSPDIEPLCGKVLPIENSKKKSVWDFFKKFKKNKD